MSRKLWFVLASSIALFAATASAAEVQGTALHGPLRFFKIGGQPKAPADAVIYDSFTTATNPSFTSSTPHTFMGGVFTGAPSGSSADISAISVFMVSIAAVDYTDIQASVQIWDTYSDSSTPVFSAAAGGLVTADLGAVSTAATSFYELDLTLNTPIHVSNTSNLGIAVSFSGDSGSGLGPDTNLTSLLTYGGPVSVGSDPIAGNYYRNASGRTDFNFASTDLRSLGLADLALATIITGAVTLPVTLQSFDVK